MSFALNIPTKYSLNIVLEKIEFGTLVVMLLYFLGVSLPSPLPKLLNVGSYGIVAVLIMLNFNRVVRVASQGLFVWLLVLLAIASVSWSVNPEVSMNTARGLVRTSLLGVYLAARYPFREQMRLWLWVFGLALAFSLFAGIIQGQTGAWRGAFPQKNYLARIMSLSAELFLVTCLTERKIRNVAFIGFFLAFCVLLLSQGKTSLVLFLFMTMLLPLNLFLMQHYKLQVFIYALSLIIIGVTATLVLSNIETIVVDILGKNMELNGRLPVWELCIDKIQERPWFGYGYAAFWHSPESLYITDNTWASVGYLKGGSFNPHHGFIGLALSIGLSGVALISASFASTFITVFKILRVTRRIECLWMLQFLLFLLLFNLFDNAGLVTGKDALWSFYVSVSFSAAIIYNHIKKDFRDLKERTVT